jgi:CubicO group peptidase (beta-lactamase class C family)
METKMSRTNLVILIVIGLFVLSTYNCSGANEIKEKKLQFSDELQKTLNEGLETTNGTGVSASVIVQDQGTWIGTGGFLSPDTSDRITSDMAFIIASIGKNFIAVLTLKMVEDGILSLNDPLKDWLPEYRHIDPGITIRQLLNHTSGIFDFVKHRNSPFQKSFHEIQHIREWTSNEILTTLLEEPYFSPGNGWQYSSTNYVLLKMILEKAAKKKVSDLLKDRFLKPLDLNSTLPVQEGTKIPVGYKLAPRWYDANGDGLEDDVNLYPQIWMVTIVPHLIYSTAHDLSKWSQALFQGRIIKQSLIDEMTEFYRPAPEAIYSGYGLGLGEIQDQLFNGEKAWGHVGKDFGCLACMVYFPNHSVSVSVLTNDNNEECIIYITSKLWSVIQEHLAN